MAVVRRASSTWRGTLARGDGIIEVGSGAVAPLPLSLSGRISETATETGPEELIAAAYSGCLAMSIASALTEHGLPAESLRVDAVCTEDQVHDGFAITDLAVTVTARLTGLDDSAFATLVEEAERGCPLSRALRGNVAIKVASRLES